MNLSKIVALILSILSILLSIGIIIGLASITTVPTGFVGVKTRFGKVQNDVIQEGLNTKAPFIEKIIKIDCRTRKLEESSEAATKDLQTVATSIAVNYNVNKETANSLYKDVGIDYEEILIKPAILESIKSAVAQYTAEELVTKRADVSNEIQNRLSNKIQNRGFIITEFNITNIDFSEEYDRAVEAKAVKRQEVVAAQAEYEKQKIQNEKELSTAEKDVKVMELQNQQITENTLRLKELDVKQSLINKWNGQLPTTSMGSTIPFLNIEN